MELEFMVMAGVILGISAGISPGPLSVLVISETLRYGLRSGIKVALTPLITDLPIVLISLFVLSKIASSGTVLGMLSICGAIVVMYLGLKTIANPLPLNCEPGEETGSFSVLKGTVVNFLNPHPYLFWFTIGGPLLVRAFRSSAFSALIFIAAFYLCLIGAKVFMAVAVNITKGLFVKSRFYIYFVRLSGFVLCAFSFGLFYYGLMLMKEK